MSIKIEHNWEGQQWDWPLQHNDGVVKVLIPIPFSSLLISPLKVHNDKDKFEVALEAQHFTPSEIQVRNIRE